MEKITLENVHEYYENFNVELGYYNTNPNKPPYSPDPNPINTLCVFAFNEGGYNGIAINAKELYIALQKYFENNGK